MGALDHSPGTPEHTTEKWRLNLLAHFVCLQDEAGRSIAHSYLARGTLLLCLGIQIYCRLFGNNMSVLSEILTSGFAEVFLLALILIPTLITAFFIWTCFVPSGRRLQKWAIDSGLPHILFMIYAGLQTLNALLVTPISLAIFSRGLFWSSTSPGVYKGHTHEDLLGNMTPASVALFYVMIVPSILSLAASLSYGSFGISMLRSNEFLSASNRIPFLLFALGFFLTLICNMVTFNIQGPMFSMGTGIFLNIISLAASLLSIVVSGHYTVFYHRSYRTIAMQGTWMLLVSTLFDMIYTGQDRKGSMQIALISFTVFAFGSRLISNWDHHIEIVDPESEYISLRTIISLEQAFHEHRLGSAMMKSIMIRVQTFLKNQVDPSKRDQVFKSSSDLETSNQDLVAMYLFTLFDQASRNSSKMDFMVGFYFANFLSNQKTNYLYLAVLVRKLKDSELSFSEAFHVHRLETLITQSLKQKEIESSGTVHDDRRKMRSHSMQTNKTSLNLYKTVETIKLYEQLMKAMRKQIDLVVNFYEQLEQPTTWIVKLHETVEQINKGRVICADLFDRVDEASSTMQAFHILPYALFLEQTENNFEKGTELVKYYDSKTNMMFKHLGRSIRESLLENSITLVVEAEKGRIGNIVFTSRNMRQAFGPEVPDIDGQSLDLFFNPDMAKVHQMEMERFLAKLDREYLGYRQQRYITFGNSIYYRVTVVTKFVPHIEEGFRLVLLIKNLSLDLVDGNLGAMDTINFAVDGNFQIVGVCHNKNLFRDGTVLNPSVEALIGQPLEVVSPESKELIEAYFTAVHQDANLNSRDKRIARKKLLLSVIGEKLYRKFFNKEDILTGQTMSTKQDKLFSKQSNRQTDADGDELAEKNISAEELEVQMKQLEEEVQNLKAGIKDEAFPQIGTNVTLQIVQLQKETPISENLRPEVLVVPAVARVQSFQISHIADSIRPLFVDEVALKYKDHDDVHNGRRKHQEPILSTRRELKVESELDSQHLLPATKMSADLAVLSLSLRPASTHEINQTTASMIPRHTEYRGAVTLGLFKGDTTTSAKISELPKGLSSDEREVLPDLQDHGDADSPRARHLVPSKLPMRKESLEILSSKHIEKPPILPKVILTTVPLDREQENDPQKKEIPSPIKLQKKQIMKLNEKNLKARQEEAKSYKDSLKKMYEQKYTEDKSSNQIPTLIENLVSEMAPSKSQHSGTLHNPPQTVVLSSPSLQADQPGGTNSPRNQNPGFRTTFLARATELKTLFPGGSSQMVDSDPLQPSPADGNIKSNSRSVLRSKQGIVLDPQNQPGANKMAEVIDQGSMRSSNRTSHTGSRSHLVIRKMMKNPKINRLPQLFIGFLLAAMLILVHVFQEYLRIEFADIFDEVNELQYVFVTIVSLDCYFKGALVNVLESQITQAAHNISESRYQFLDPDLTNIREESKREFEYHMKRASKEQTNLLKGISDLNSENTVKFLNSDTMVEIRVPLTGNLSIAGNVDAENVSTNPLELSLLILYDLHVWWDEKDLYGDWASYNYYYYAVVNWLKAVEEVFEDFNTASLDAIQNIKDKSIYLLISFSLITQSLLGLMYFQARTIRRGMIGTMKNLENLRMFEILTKQDRLRYLLSIFADTSDVEAHKRKIVSILRGMRGSRRGEGLDNSFHGLESLVAETKPHTVTKSNPTKSSQILPKQHHPQLAKTQPGGGVDPNAAGSMVTPSTDRRHVAGMYKMKKENKDTSFMIGNKLKILPTQWMGFGVLLSCLILVAEVQVGLNLVTSDRQRSSAVSYTNWMNVNRDYFLYIFYINNLEAVIYIDSAGDMDLIELVPDLNGLAFKYFDTQRELAIKTVRQLRALDSDTRKFGYGQFFTDPCKAIDLNVYGVKQSDCQKFAGGVGSSGYINFMEYTRILVEQVRDNFMNEGVLGMRIVNTTSFLTFNYFNKVINRPMFEAIRIEMIDAADNVNDQSDEFVNLFGTVFQSLLSCVICVMFVYLVYRIDHATGLCYSIFLLLPEETYTINHYIRGFIKRLDG